MKSIVLFVRFRIGTNLQETMNCQVLVLHERTYIQLPEKSIKIHQPFLTPYLWKARYFSYTSMEQLATD